MNLFYIQAVYLLIFNEFEQVPLAHDKYRLIQKKTVQKITSAFTAKYQMDRKKELKKERLNKRKADTLEKTGRKHARNEQN